MRSLFAPVASPWIQVRVVVAACYLLVGFLCFAVMSGWTSFRPIFLVAAAMPVFIEIALVVAHAVSVKESRFRDGRGDLILTWPLYGLAFTLIFVPLLTGDDSGNWVGPYLALLFAGLLIEGADFLVRRFLDARRPAAREDSPS